MLGMRNWADGWAVWLLVFLIIVGCFSAGYLLSRMRFSDDFFYIPLSRVRSDGSLVEEDFPGFYFLEEHQGYEISLSAMGSVLGLGPGGVQFLPVGVVLVSVLGFLVVFRLTGSCLVSSAFAVYLSFDASLAPGHYSPFNYMWSRSLFLAFIYLASLQVERRDWRIWVLALLVFVAAFTVTWTGSIMMIVFSAVLSALVLALPFLGVRGMRERIPWIRGLATPASLFVIYLSFSSTLYAQYIPRLLAPGASSHAFSMLLDLGSFFGGSRAGEFAVAPVGDPVLYWLLTLRYLVLVVPILFFPLLRLRGAGRSRVRVLDVLGGRFFPVVGGLLIVGGVHFVSYMIYGHPSFRYVAFLYPIVALFMVARERGLVRIGYTVLVVFLSVSGFVLFYLEMNQTNTVPYVALERSPDWLMERGDGEKVLSDLGLYGVHLLRGSGNNFLFEIVPVDQDFYYWIRFQADRPAEEWPDFIVLRQDETPVTGVGWLSLEPISGHIAHLDVHREAVRIYDSSVAVYTVPSKRSG